MRNGAVRLFAVRCGVLNRTSGITRLRNDEIAVRRKVLEQEVQRGEWAALKWMGAAGASSLVSAGRKRKRNCQDSAVGKRGGGQSNSVVSDEDDEEPEQ